MQNEKYCLTLRILKHTFCFSSFLDVISRKPTNAPPTMSRVHQGHKRELFNTLLLNPTFRCCFVKELNICIEKEESFSLLFLLANCFLFIFLIIFAFIELIPTHNRCHKGYSPPLPICWFMFQWKEFVPSFRSVLRPHEYPWTFVNKSIFRGFYNI